MGLGNDWKFTSMQAQYGNNWLWVSFAFLKPLHYQFIQDFYRMLRKSYRAEAYRLYHKTTSVWIPWFKASGELEKENHLMGTVFLIYRASTFFANVSSVGTDLLSLYPSYQCRTSASELVIWQL